MSTVLFENIVFSVEEDLLGETLLIFNQEYTFESKELIDLVLFLVSFDETFTRELLAQAKALILPSLLKQHE